MCVYCMMADWAKKWTPDTSTPAIPMPGLPPPLPVIPYRPWTQEQLTQFMDILAKIKELEDKLGGCPCEEPEKLDYLNLLQQRLDDLDKKIEEKNKAATTTIQEQETTQLIKDFMAKYPQNMDTTDDGKVFIGGAWSSIAPKV